MGFHHVAVAVRNLDATHRFYTEAMGFALAKVQVVEGDRPGTWAKHVFYDTGGDGMIAFWELHDDRIDTDRDLSLSGALGLPVYVNHLAFGASDLDDLETRRHRWLDAGHDVARIDHGWCVSIYTQDPDGTLVEWCCTTRTLDESDRTEAVTLLADPAPAVEGQPDVEFTRASSPVAAGP